MDIEGFGGESRKHVGLQFSRTHDDSKSVTKA